LKINVLGSLPSVATEGREKEKGRAPKSLIFLKFMPEFVYTAVQHSLLILSMLFNIL